MNMKNTIITLVLVVFAIGCSKQNIQFAMKRGDLSSVEVGTNSSQAYDHYFIGVRLTGGKEAELCKLAQQNTNRDIDIIFGSTFTFKLEQPGFSLKLPLHPMQFHIPCSSLEKAKIMEKGLQELQQ